MPPHQNPWTWDPMRQEYYLYDHKEKCYLYYGGRKIDHQGRNIAENASSANTSTPSGLSLATSTMNQPTSQSEGATLVTVNPKQLVDPKHDVDTRSFLTPRGTEKDMMNSPAPNCLGTLDGSTALKTPYAQPVSDPSGQDRTKMSEPQLSELSIKAHAAPIMDVGKEKEDHGFQEQPDYFFRRGRVFEVVWPEARGKSLKSTRMGDPFDEMIDPTQNFFTKVRKFIIIKEGSIFCTCLPIELFQDGRMPSSSRGQQHHAFVFTGSVDPTFEQSIVSKEQAPFPPGIRIDLEDESRPLGKMSVINFSKLYTVEHRFIARTIGFVRPEYMNKFVTQWIKVITDHQDVSLLSQEVEEDESQREGLVDYGYDDYEEDQEFDCGDDEERGEIDYDEDSSRDESSDDICQLIRFSEAECPVNGFEHEMHPYGELFAIQAANLAPDVDSYNTVKSNDLLAVASSRKIAPEADGPNDHTIYDMNQYSVDKAVQSHSQFNKHHPIGLRCSSLEQELMGLEDKNSKMLQHSRGDSLKNEARSVEQEDRGEIVYENLHKDQRQQEETLNTAPKLQQASQQKQERDQKEWVRQLDERLRWQEEEEAVLERVVAEAKNSEEQREMWRQHAISLLKLQDQKQREAQETDEKRKENEAKKYEEFQKGIRLQRELYLQEEKEAIQRAQEEQNQLDETKKRTEAETNKYEEFQKEIRLQRELHLRMENLLSKHAQGEQKRLQLQEMQQREQEFKSRNDAPKDDIPWPISHARELHYSPTESFASQLEYYKNAPAISGNSSKDSAEVSLLEPKKGTLLDLTPPTTVKNLLAFFTAEEVKPREAHLLPEPDLVKMPDQTEMDWNAEMDWITGRRSLHKKEHGLDARALENLESDDNLRAEASTLLKETSEAHDGNTSDYIPFEEDSDFDDADESDSVMLDKTSKPHNIIPSSISRTGVNHPKDTDCVENPVPERTFEEYQAELALLEQFQQSHDNSDRSGLDTAAIINPVPERTLEDYHAELYLLKELARKHVDQQTFDRNRPVPVPVPSNDTTQPLESSKNIKGVFHGDNFKYPTPFELDWDTAAFSRLEKRCEAEPRDFLAMMMLAESKDRRKARGADEGGVALPAECNSKNESRLNIPMLPARYKTPLRGPLIRPAPAKPFHMSQPVDQFELTKKLESVAVTGSVLQRSGLQPGSHTFNSASRNLQYYSDQHDLPEAAEEPQVAEKPELFENPELADIPEPVTKTGLCDNPGIEGISEPAPITEPERFTEPEQLAEPEELFRPKKLSESEELFEPEQLSEPEQFSEPEDLFQLDDISEPEELFNPETESSLVKQPNTLSSLNPSPSPSPPPTGILSLTQLKQSLEDQRLANIRAEMAAKQAAEEELDRAMDESLYDAAREQVSTTATPWTQTSSLMSSLAANTHRSVVGLAGTSSAVPAPADRGVAGGFQLLRLVGWGSAEKGKGPATDK